MAAAAAQHLQRLREGCDLPRWTQVLVKNEADTLPLKKGSGVSIALVGPNADATVTMQSNYHGTAPYLISPAEGLMNYSKSVNVVPGLVRDILA